MTVLIAAIALGLVGWVVTTQVSSLVRELPKYSQNIKEKAKSLKNASQGSSGWARLVRDLNHELGLSHQSSNADGEEKDTKEASADSKDKDTREASADSKDKDTKEASADTKLAGDDTTAKEEKPTTQGSAAARPSSPPERIIVEPQTPAWLSRISGFLAPVLEHLGEFGLAIILVVFMLQKREELRNRVIRLFGPGQIVTATKFVDEAGQRVSRFLLMQAIVNGTFGTILGVGLLLMGVKYALLWGFLAAILRYLPYIGPYIAAVFPISITLAMFDGWTTALMVAGLFIALELVTANFIEPWLYGQSMGVSEIALLVSAAFWAFLWGPVGLVLSSPLTVCLVMLGRYVPQLEFLAILMGDEPALDMSVSFYQRLLARDQDEAEELVLEHVKTEAPENVYDQMLIPALSAAKLSRGRGQIDNADEQYILQAIREIAEDLGDRFESATAGGCCAPAEKEKARDAEKATATNQDCSSSAARPAIRIFGCPAHDTADQTALEMLRNLLDPACWDMTIIAPETLTSELLEKIDEMRPAILCLATTAPDGIAHTRYLCKRIRGRFPEIKIVVCRWGKKTGRQTDPARLTEVGADSVATSLLETRQVLASLLPVLAHVQSESDARAPDRRDGAGLIDARKPSERDGRAGDRVPATNAVSR